jgi:NAD(P)-dependent dehydrogenase (short-subunit alcohol dehydrogenase family)
MTGQVAIVTGGAKGIGKAIADRLAQDGLRIVIADLQGAEEAASAYDGGVGLTVDVASELDVERMAAEVEERCGRIDVLVNNAGTYLEAGSILDQTHESWRRSIDVNLAGVFNCSKPAARALVDQAEGGAIVNIASVDGFLPCLGTGYDSAKAAVIHLTRSLAVDLAPHGVRVNGIAPGHVPVPTLDRIHSGELPPLWPADSSTTGLMGPMMRQRGRNIPLGRSARPEEIANAVLFLATAASSYVTGQTLAVDGGWLLV